MRRNRHDQETGLVASVRSELGINNRDDVVVTKTPQNHYFLAETADAVLVSQPLQCPFARKFAGQVGDAIHIALTAATYTADDFPTVAVCLRLRHPTDPLSCEQPPGSRRFSIIRQCSEQRLRAGPGRKVIAGHQRTCRLQQDTGAGH
jgi:hypothetical protein